MLEITKSIEWDMGHRIPKHSHKCRNPHGHRYRLELTLSGAVNTERGSSQEGMVHDFGDIKTHMEETIYQRLDHCFLAAEDDPIFAHIAHEHPDLKIILVPFIPTAENILVWCYQALSENFPGHLRITKLRLHETPTSFAEYTPSR